MYKYCLICMTDMHVFGAYFGPSPEACDHHWNTCCQNKNWTYVAVVKLPN